MEKAEDLIQASQNIRDGLRAKRGVWGIFGGGFLGFRYGGVRKQWKTQQNIATTMKNQGKTKEN